MRHVLILNSIPGFLLNISKDKDFPEFRRINSDKGVIQGGYINKLTALAAAKVYEKKGYSVKVRPWSKAQHGDFDEINGFPRAKLNNIGVNYDPYNRM